MIGERRVGHLTMNAVFFNYLILKLNIEGIFCGITALLSMLCKYLKL